MPDPTTTYRLATAAVPEWAEAATVGAPKMLAEIRKVRDEVMTLGRMLADRENLIAHYEIETAGLREELADVKAECCRLVCRNGDMEAENARLKVEMDGLRDEFAELAELADLRGMELARNAVDFQTLTAAHEKLRGETLSVISSSLERGPTVNVSSYWFDRMVQAAKGTPTKEPQ